MPAPAGRRSARSTPASAATSPTSPSPSTTTPRRRSCGCATADQPTDGALRSTSPAPSSTKTQSCPAARSPEPQKKLSIAPAGSTSPTPPPGYHPRRTNEPDHLGTARYGSLSACGAASVKRTATAVGPPDGLFSSRCPPAASARSTMPWRPNPFPNLAPPIPSSVTTRRIQLPSSSALIVTCFARACTLRDLDAFPELLDRVWAALLANVYDIFAAWLDDQNTRRGTPIVDAPATAAVLLASLTYAPILDALIGHIPADIDHARYRSAWVAPRAQHAHDRGICAVAVV